MRLTQLVTALVWIMRAMRCKFLRKILHNIHRAIITLTVVVLPVSIAILVSVAGLGPMSRSFIGSFSVNRDNSFYVRLVFWRPDKSKSLQEVSTFPKIRKLKLLIALN